MTNHKTTTSGSVACAVLAALVCSALFLVAATGISSADESDTRPDRIAEDRPLATISPIGGGVPADLDEHTARIRSLAYTTRLAAISARYKTRLLGVLDLEGWTPVKEDGFEDYERIAESGQRQPVGQVPQGQIARALNSQTVLPVGDGSGGRDEQVYLYTRLLCLNYLELASEDRPQFMEAAVVACSHHVDLVLGARWLDYPSHEVPRTLDAVFNALLAEEIGYVSQLDESDVNAIRELHQAFREEVEAVRISHDRESPK